MAITTSIMAIPTGTGAISVAITMMLMVTPTATALIPMATSIGRRAARRPWWRWLTGAGR